MEGELKTLSMDEGLVARQAAGAVLADVREIGEFAEGHIPGAINIPLSTLGPSDTHEQEHSGLRLLPFGTSLAGCG